MFYCVYIFRVFFSMSNPKKETPFELKTEENTQFSNKCKDIFGNLEKFERKHEEYNKSRSDDKDEGMQKADPGDMDTETITSAFKTPCQPKREEGQSWRSHHDRSQNRDDGPPPGENIGQTQEGPAVFRGSFNQNSLGIEEEDTLTIETEEIGYKGLPIIKRILGNGRNIP